MSTIIDAMIFIGSFTGIALAVGGAAEIIGSLRKRGRRARCSQCRRYSARLADDLCQQCWERDFISGNEVG